MGERGARIYRFPSHRMRSDREPWLTKREVADYLSVSERWIELRMKHDGFPFHKDKRSRLVRYRLSEVDAWMEARERKP